MMREVVSIGLLTYLLIAGLNLAVGGTLFGWLYERHRAECEAQNRALLERGAHGPVQAC